MDPLCHYTRAEAALEHIIPSGNLHMSPYARMRDPLENHELTFSGSLPLDGRPDEALARGTDGSDGRRALRVRRIRESDAVAHRRRDDGLRRRTGRAVAAPRGPRSARTRAASM